MAITNQPHVSDDDIHVLPLYFPTVIEPYDAKCEDCGRVIKNTKEEFCQKCDGFLIDLRQLDAARIDRESEAIDREMLRAEQEDYEAERRAA